MNKPTHHPPSGTAWKRPYLEDILLAALEAGENRFIHQVTLAWLAYFPGDLPVKLLRAKALVTEGLEEQALPILQNLVNLDPEYQEAQKYIHLVSNKLDVAGKDIVFGCSVALGNLPKHIDTQTSKNISWSYTLGLSRKYLSKGDLKNAEIQIQQVLASAPPTPLIHVTHLKFLQLEENTPKKTLQNLAEHYHEKWPECLHFSLLLADVLMDAGEVDRAVSLLHQVASQDITGQVARRIWGVNHPYRNLWPKQMEAPIYAQIPPRVAAYFGWNLLSESELQNPIENDESTPPIQLSTFPVDGPRATRNSNTNLPENLPVSETLPRRVVDNDLEATKEPPTKPETVISIDQFEQDSLQPITHPNSEGRFPIYVICSTKKGLHRKYGEKTALILDRALRKLVSSLRQRLDWGAILVYVDDPGNMAQYGLKPVPPDDPWKIKLALVDLDDALGKRGARIGALLIIGGTEVVPFHHLPNPTDDADSTVPSDNPYATKDENYFIPEWPVGRLPGGMGKDPGLLLSSLRSITETHNDYKTQPENPFFSFWYWISSFIKSNWNGTQKSFGYTAEAWQQASGSVFRVIGDPKTLFTSPPIVINQTQPLPTTKLGYFNLHGIQDAAEWFGQKDPSNGDNQPEYPIALHPKDVVSSGRPPRVIFSEACYGAHVLDKSIEDALSLKFLASGTQAFVGSTVISYGSVEPPLNAADLLGKAFWGFFKEGFPAGESLRRAKIFLAKEMHQRQGYLDGEDQKTLISFVLFGDPLSQESDSKKSLKKFINRVQPLEEIKTVCDRVGVPGTSEPIPKEVVANIKKIVDQYLPGMRDAKYWLSHEHAECSSEGHICPTSQLGGKTKVKAKPQRRVVTLSKQIVNTKHIHETYARFTIDQDGNVIKLAVSR